MVDTVDQVFVLLIRKYSDYTKCLMNLLKLSSENSK